MACGVDAEFVVAAPAQDGSNDATRGLLRFTVERNHQFGSVHVRVAGAVGIADGLQALGKRFGRGFGLGCPVAVQVADPHVALAQCQVARIEALERDSTFLLVRDFSPSLNHVHVFVGFIEHFHCDGQQFVGHRENVKLRAVVAARLVVGDLEFKVQVAVGMLHLNSWQLDGVHGAECGQCREVKVGTTVTQLLQCGALVAVVAHAQVAALIGV